MLEPLICFLCCNTTTCLKQCLNSIVLISYNPPIASNICFYFRTFVNIMYYYGIKDLQQLKDSSIGVKSGEYGGRYDIIQPELCQMAIATHISTDSLALCTRSTKRPLWWILQLLRTRIDCSSGHRFICGNYTTCQYIYPCRWRRQSHHSFHNEIIEGHGIKRIWNSMHSNVAINCYCCNKGIAVPSDEDISQLSTDTRYSVAPMSCSWVVILACFIDNDKFASLPFTMFKNKLLPFKPESCIPLKCKFLKQFPCQPSCL